MSSTTRSSRPFPFHPNWLMNATTKESITPKIEEIKDYSLYHQRISLGPFERGFGYTLGNALRRVLLSSVPGFAATEVKIDGVEHQYSTISGVAEDVIEILLNLKGVVFRVETTDTVECSIDVAGPGNITAGDIKLPGQATVLNPDHHIASLADDGKLKMTIQVEGGRGYRPASAVDQKDKSFGTILLDASFSPVRNVAIHVEGARVSSRTDLDRLIIDLKTNGVHSPEEIIRFAARQLIEQLQTFAELDESQMRLDAIGTQREETADQRFYEPLDVLELNVRYINNLKQENIFYVGELVKMTEAELMRTPRLGRKSVDEIKLVLAQNNLELGMDIGEFEPDKPVT